MWTDPQKGDKTCPPDAVEQIVTDEEFYLLKPAEAPERVIVCGRLRYGELKSAFK